MWYVYFRRAVLSVFAVCVGAAIAVSLFLWNCVQVKADGQREFLSFPVTVEGTDLVAEFFVSYEGDYFEDKSGTFLVDGAALYLYNRSDHYIDYARVYIETLDGIYCFEGTYIPPHGKIMILEKYKALYPQGEVCFAGGQSVTSKDRNFLEDLEIQPVDMGKCKVTNISDVTLRNIRLFYKQYDSQCDTLLGGITYVVSAGNLEAGESVVLFPANYANGYSKIIFATAQ